MGETPLSLFLIPGSVLVVTWAIIWVAGRVPQVLVVPVLLPALGMASNWIMVQAGMPGVSPTLAILLGIATAGIHKAIEHIQSAGMAVLDKHPADALKLPMTEAARLREK